MFQLLRHYGILKIRISQNNHTLNKFMKRNVFSVYQKLHIKHSKKNAFDFDFL